MEGIKFEDSVEYWFKLVSDDAYERGIEENKLDMIKFMLENNADYEFISKVSSKSIEEIKEIEKSMKN